MRKLAVAAAHTDMATAARALAENSRGSSGSSYIRTSH